MIRILLVDDHDLVREGMRALLEKEDDFSVVGEARDGEAAVRRARELMPDVVLMDISLPGGLGGLEATEAIRSERPGIKVILLTQYDHREYIRRAVKIGAHGYVLKRGGYRELESAIRAVVRGERYLHPSVAGELVEMVASGHGLDDDEYGRLTQREKQVFDLLIDGKTSREIAQYLGISLKTAMTHRTHLMTKLGLHSRSELIRYALRKGLLQIDSL